MTLLEEFVAVAPKEWRPLLKSDGTVYLGKPFQCSVCGTTNAKHYDYANLSGRYEDMNDYAPMCRSCHWKYDDKVSNIFKGRRDADVQVA